MIEVKYKSGEGDWRQSYFDSVDSMRAKHIAFLEGEGDMIDDKGTILEGFTRTSIILVKPGDVDFKIDETF